MKYSLLIVPILLCLQLSAQPKQLHFRTDGYYYYDNKCDTIFLAQMTAKQKLELESMLNSIGSKTVDVDCIPEGQSGIMGGSEIEVMSFFTEIGQYTNFYLACWNFSNSKRAIKSLEKRKAQFANHIIDKSNVMNFILKKDNTFNNLSNVVKISGTLYRDSIVITQSLPKEIGFKFWQGSRTYRFYSFDECPPPIRDKFIYVYKDPFKQ